MPKESIRNRYKTDRTIKTKYKLEDDEKSLNKQLTCGPKANNGN